nr:PLP-dependent aminotransferase family protein [uncultured Comamonas sp.]
MSNSMPGFESLAQSIEREIRHGAYKTGEKLPSIRELARLRKCAKNTVVVAFELLVARGLVEPVRGAGFYVKELPIRVELDTSNHSLGRARDTAWLIREQLKNDPDSIPAADGFPPADWLAGARLDKVHHKVARSGLGTLFNYGNRFGYLPLRQQLVRKLGSLGITADLQQIVLTHGANQAMDLVMRYFVPPGATVLVDDPGYYFLFGKLKVHGATIVGIPRTATGPDLDALEQAIIRTRARIFFTQSVGHNPTGSDLCPATAIKLVKLAEKYNLLLVEMDPLADLKGSYKQRLSTIDQLQRTIYIGTFSKSLSAALRVGFIACSADLASELADLKSIIHVSSSEYSERTVDAILRERSYDKHLHNLQLKLKNATATAYRFLEELDATFFCRPPESLYMWASFAGIPDSTHLAEWLGQHNVTVAPGKIFCPHTNTPCATMRLNTGVVASEKLQTILRTAIPQYRALVAAQSANGE